MLEEIIIENLGVIKKAEIRPHAGLTVITGETGTGKSMVLNALGMLLGKRANQSLIHNGEKIAKVQGCWNILGDEKIANKVDSFGGEIEDDELIIARSINDEGKSKATLAGSRVTSSKLAEVGERLVNIHGQSDQIKLKNPVAQLRTIDRFINKIEKNETKEDFITFEKLMQKLSVSYEIWKEAHENLKDAKDNSEARKHQISFMRSFIEEFEKISPEKQEISELETEINVLSHIADIYHFASSALFTISPESDSEMPKISEQLSNINSLIDSIAQFDKSEKVEQMSALAENIYGGLNELENMLEGYVNDTDAASIEELHDKEDRLVSLKQLVKRYSSSDFFSETDEALDNVISQYESSAKNLAEIELLNRPLSELEEDMREAFEKLVQDAQKVTQRRMGAAEKLGQLVNVELEALAMGGMKFSADITSDFGESKITKKGADEVSFNILAPGSIQASPIAKTASGGELSRIMLALEVVIADPSETATFVFDEVDSGVGGATAIEIGKRLAKLSREAQVILVTHLPQIAVLGDKHLKVVKNVSADNVITTVETLDYDMQVSEIARMLSGMEESESGREHARELLAYSQEYKESIGIEVSEDVYDSSKLEEPTIIEKHDDSPKDEEEALEDYYTLKNFNVKVTPVVIGMANEEDALMLIGEDGKMHSTATNCYRFHVHPDDGNIIISNEGEFEGLAEELLDLGIISEIVQKVGYGNKPDSAAYEIKMKSK